MRSRPALRKTRNNRNYWLHKYLLRASLFLLVFAFFSLNTPKTLAYSGDLTLTNQSIRFNMSTFLEGRTVRIYATALNNSHQDLLGVVRFYDNGGQIGTDQSISIYKGGTDDVFTDWTPVTFGNHEISVQIFAWEPESDNPNNNWISRSIYVEQDTDRDGIPNPQDDDDDNDGYKDEDDHFPQDENEWVDSDGDTKGDNSDEDDDNDGVPDTHDDMPLDPDESLDTDKDGIGNVADPDDDNDGIPDNLEEQAKTNPLSADSDEDGINDKLDPFPLDPEESEDTDGDRIGNNKDTDDDNDGIPDSEDNFPLNKAPIIDIADIGQANVIQAGFMEPIKFDSSNSRDEDGNITAHLWEIDGKQVESPYFTHTFMQKGQHTLTFTVKDDHGEIVSRELQVNVVNIRLQRQLMTSLLTLILGAILVLHFRLPRKPEI